MDISLTKLNHAFRKKPLLVGGKAMEYYGLRQSGADIDFIADKEDVFDLIKQYPARVKDLWGDLGVCPFEFEIWKSICLFHYTDLCENAQDEGDFLVISLEKLLIMKACAMHIEKYRVDTQLIVQELLKRQYQAYDQNRVENMDFLSPIQGITYLEKTGPVSDEILP
ncbi:MAG TPA: hypothetical protein VIO61_01805 [Anaerolineaceae bacterium]